jgi:hypothetical protein
MTSLKLVLIVFFLAVLYQDVLAFRRYYYPTSDCTGPPMLPVNLKNHQECQVGMYRNEYIVFQEKCEEGKPLPFLISSKPDCSKIRSSGVMRPQTGCIEYDDYSVLTDCAED